MGPHYATAAGYGLLATSLRPFIQHPGDLPVRPDDVAVLAEHWGGAVTTGDYTSGDFNSDGVVNALDASILAANWTGSGGETANVPEPGIAILMLGAGLALLVRRSCRSSRCDRD